MSGSQDPLSDRQGWLVVAVIAVLIVVVPGFLLLTTPRDLGSFGIYVAIAMLPALAFGAFGVWTALRHGGE